MTEKSNLEKGADDFAAAARALFMEAGGTLACVAIVPGVDKRTITFISPMPAHIAIELMRMASEEAATQGTKKVSIDKGKELH